MKSIIQKLWVVIAMLCLSISASAYDFEVDGIYYNVVSLEDLTCEVTYNTKNISSTHITFNDKRGNSIYSSYLNTTFPSYSGAITIPSTVNYKGRELSVTGIGEYAFLNCTGLKSLSLPSSIYYIREVLVNSSSDCYAGAFDYCGIESLTVGNAYTLKMFNQSYASNSGYRTKDNLKNLVLTEDFKGTIDVNFSDYQKLVSIRSNVIDVPTFSEGAHFTNNQFINILILVPSLSIESYKLSNQWSFFWDITNWESSQTPPNQLYSYDFKVDGIYYNILSLEDLTCEVTYNTENISGAHRTFNDKRGNSIYSSYLNTTFPSYSGAITIPSTVNYKGRELSVTGIGEYAFLNCTGLKSLSLPSSITQIKEVLVNSSSDCYAGAFDYCGIESLTAGNAYTLQMFNQSYACSSGYKTKDNLKNLVLTEDFKGIIDVNFSDYKKLVSIRSNVVDVPAFSEGSHFTNEQYLNTEVLIPEDAFSSYQSADIWKSFWELKAMKAVKSITINETSLNLEPKQTVRLVATVLPEDALDATVEWKSSNPSVASVDETGLVTAITKGDAVISVSSTDGSNVSAQCSVHVDLLVKKIVLSKSEIGLEPGESKKLIVAIAPIEAFVKDVIWTSDSEDVATVDDNGIVTAKSIGIANITVQTTDGSDLNANCKVTVAELVKAIVISPNEATIKEDENLQLSCSVMPETATYKEVKWVSEYTDVAIVDANGLVTAISSGTTIIKAIATDGSDVYGECRITVTAETLEIGGICYQRNSPSTLKIVANSKNPYSGDVFIPTAADFKGQEMKVTEIDTEAFAGCKDLTRIVIPNTVSKIDDSAFVGCQNLVYVKICDGSSLNVNLDKLFSDAPINELYIGSNAITYDSDSRLSNIVKGMTLSGSVTTFPPSQIFKSLEYFIVEGGDNPMVEPEDYCTKSMSQINKQTIKDPYTYIYYRIFYSVIYTHLSPILKAMENSTLNYVHIDREVQGVDVDTSKTKETILTTAGSIYQGYGYKDECNYSYQEIIANKDYNRNPIERISFAKNLIRLKIGESICPKIIFNPQNASLTTLEWHSSDEKIASVDMFGNILSLTEGEVKITAISTDGTNLSASCDVIVGDYVEVESVSLDFEELLMTETETVQLNATISPNNATDTALNWASSNENVATVDSNGLITAMGVGEAIITATSVDGEHFAECKVTVIKKSGLNENLADNDISIHSTGCGVVVKGADGMPVLVNSIDGILQEQIAKYRGEEIEIASGIYLFTIGNRTFKVRL